MFWQISLLKPVLFIKIAMPTIEHARHCRYCNQVNVEGSIFTTRLSVSNHQGVSTCVAVLWTHSQTKHSVPGVID